MSIASHGRDEMVESGSPDSPRRRRPTAKSFGLALAGLGFVVILLIPFDVTADQRMLTAVMWLMIVLWITEALPLPVTSLVGLGLCATLGIAPDDGERSSADIVFGSFSSSVIFLLIGGFFFARAIQVHGLDQRLALRVLSLPGVASSSYRVVVAFGFVSLVTSAFVSNSATAAMLVPIGLGLVRTLTPAIKGGGAAGGLTRADNKFATAVMLMIAYASALGGLLTPVGSPVNLVGIGYLRELTGHPVTFLQWTAATAPIVLAMFVVLCVLLLLLNRPEQRRLSVDDFLREQRAALGPMARGEKNTLLAFAVVVSGWIFPGVVSLAFGTNSAFAEAVNERMNDGAVAILAAGLLFLLPGDGPRTRVLTWTQATQIDWGVILLVGTGITLGTLLNSTGLAALAGGAIGELMDFPSLVVITLLAAALAILMSEIASNAASVAVVVPMIIPIAEAAGVNPVIPAIASVFGGSFGFMLPISQVPNAIVYATGLVPIPRMVRSGVVFDVIGALLLTAGVLLWSPVVGLA